MPLKHLLEPVGDMYCFSNNFRMLLVYMLFGGAAVAKWLSSWLAEQEVQGSIPRLPTWISEIGYLLLPSCNMAEKQPKRRNSSIQPTNQHVFGVGYSCTKRHVIVTNSFVLLVGLRTSSQKTLGRLTWLYYLKVSVPLYPISYSGNLYASYSELIRSKYNIN